MDIVHDSGLHDDPRFGGPGTQKQGSSVPNPGFMDPGSPDLRFRLRFTEPRSRPIRDPQKLGNGPKFETLSNLKDF